MMDQRRKCTRHVAPVAIAHEKSAEKPKALLQHREEEGVACPSVRRPHKEQSC